MNTKQICRLIVPTILAGVISAMAQPVITDFNSNGEMMASNLVAASTVTVQSSSDWLASHSITWSGLSTNSVGSSGVLQAGVEIDRSGPPTFYRVVQNAPADMALIPAGAFTMGDTLDGNQFQDAAPKSVYVSAFYMDATLVPYSLWTSIYSYATNHGFSFVANSAPGQGTNYPVNSQDWYDCVKWCNARSQQSGLTPAYYTDSALTHIYTNGETDSVYVNWQANGFRLPTEAEWEKAARGGLNGLRFPWGNTISESQANYNSDGTLSYDLGPTGFNTNFDTGNQPYTNPVKYFTPNNYGLHDMAGNLWEYCWDWYSTPYGQPTTNNPTGPSSPPSSGSLRVIRGGLWDHNANFSRCANRFFHRPGDIRNEVGFRCVRGH